MSPTDYLLGTLGVYGPTVLFVVLLFGAVGVPAPGTLLLLVAGSFVEQGAMELWHVLALACAGSVVGDNLGYALGRWGGRRLAKRFSRFAGGEERLRSAEGWLRRWEGVGVFFTRWLFTPLGAFVNLTAGATGYSWPRFLAWDVLGEALWVALYILLGRFFSAQIVEIDATLGDFTWALVGLLFTIVLGWVLWRQLRAPSAEDIHSSAGAVAGETR